MASENEILINVNVDAAESAEELARVKSEIAAVKELQRALKDEEKQLNAAIRETGEASVEQQARLAELANQIATNEGDLKKLTAEEKMYTAQIQLSTQNNRVYGDSIREMGAQLLQLKTEYRGLTAAQRESAEGKELLESIQKLDTEVKNLDYSLGDHQRNVGNYQSALLGLNGNVVKVTNLFQSGFKNGLTAAGQSVKTFGKTLLTTPVGWIAAGVRALIEVFNQLKAGFERNDEAGTRLQASMRRLEPILTLIRKGFNLLADGVAAVVDVYTKVASVIVGVLIPATKDMAKANEEAAYAQDRLEERERAYAVESAKRANERAKLLQETRGNEKLTAEERIALLERSLNLERKDLEERQSIAAERLRLAEEEQKRTADYSDAMMQKIAELQAAYYEAETASIQGTMRITAQLKSAREEVERDAQQQVQREKQRQQERVRAAEEAARKRIEIEKKTQDEIRGLEDLVTSQIEDEYERRQKETEQRYNREIEDIQKRLETEKGLTAEIRETLNAQIVELEKIKYKELATIQQEWVDMQKKAAEEIAENEKRAAEESAKARADGLKGAYLEDMQRLRNEAQELLNSAFGNANEQAQIQLDYLQQQYETLLNLDNETRVAMFQNEDDYRAAVLESEAQILEAKQKAAEESANQVAEVGNVLQSLNGAMSDVFEAVAGDSEAFEKYKKAMAIVDAGISMAQAIASATSAATAGDPYTMAIRIAAAVAAVTAQFAVVIKTLKGTQIPKAQKFAKGGIVEGEQYSGDNIPIKVNSGEMILTKKQQQNLFDLIASGYNGAAIKNNDFVKELKNAIAEIPAPVLDYAEFTNFVRKVEFLEKLR